MSSLAIDGFALHHQVVVPETLEVLKREADFLSRDAKSSCVRNICQKSPRIEAITRHPALESLIPSGLTLVRSILFDKTHKNNWPVPWHQDVTIATREQKDIPGYGPWSLKDGVPHVTPPVAMLESMATIRIHLDPTPAEKGALRVIPRSHRFGRIPTADIPNYTNSDEVTCACDAGDILVMAPLVLHASNRSTVSGHRRVLHFEYARTHDLDSHLQWYESASSESAIVRPH